MPGMPHAECARPGPEIPNDQHPTMSTSPDKPNSRRRFLRTSVALVPIASVAGCDLRSSSPSATTGNAPGASAGAERAPYKPTFFDAKEWAFVQAAVDRLIPADAEGPGALESGVPEFIDRQMETPYAHGATWYMQGPFQQGVPELGYQLKLVPRDIYRLGIAAVNRYCEKTHGKAFAELDARRAIPCSARWRRAARRSTTCRPACSSASCCRTRAKAISAIRCMAAITTWPRGR
ncbi:Gluconate 2-dehydrogenase subunit 3 [Burkholderia cepacia]|nr:Gluconate 2-dehydrogenase subunit 3 [Burkholderia cepacia]